MITNNITGNCFDVRPFLVATDTCSVLAELRICHVQSEQLIARHTTVRVVRGNLSQGRYSNLGPSDFTDYTDFNKTIEPRGFKDVTTFRRFLYNRF